MKRAKLLPFVLLSAAILLFGCAAGKPVGGGVPSYSKMETHPQDQKALLYVNPERPKTAYSRFIIDPVEIYKGEDHGFGDIPMADRQMMADFTRKELARILGEKYAVVDRPGPQTLRIRLILVGLEKTNTVMRGLTYGNPMGVVMNLGKGALGEKGSFLGSITLAGEFWDTQTNTLNSAFVGKIYPFAMEPSFTAFDAAKLGVTKLGIDFRNQIDRSHEPRK